MVDGWDVDSVHVRAPGKINVFMRVGAVMEDGYHDVATAYQAVSLYEDVRAYPDDEFSLSFGGSIDTSSLPVDDSNLALKAARLLARRTGYTGGVRLEIDKHVPIAGGMGGGSADAAATLRALATLHGVALEDPRLFGIADALGSDVPACLLGRTAFGSGRGEQLEVLEGLTGTPVLLVNPGVGVSTAAVFRGWDGEDRGPIGRGDLLAIALAGRNDLEPPARAIAPAIDAVLDALAAQTGVLLARMSGSGATCFALFETDDARDAAATALAGRGWWLAATRLR